MCRCRSPKTSGPGSLLISHEQFITDVAAMPPEASAYFRRRPFLTPEVCQKFAMGYLPHSSKSLLRGQIVYGYRSPDGRAAHLVRSQCAFRRATRSLEGIGSLGTGADQNAVRERISSRVWNCTAEDIVRSRTAGRISEHGLGRGRGSE